VFRGEVEDRGDHQRFHAPGIDWAVIAEKVGPGWAGLPARDVLVSRAPVSASAMNAVHGALVAVAERGPLVLVTLETSAGEASAAVRLTAAVTRATLHDMGLAVGQDVWFVFKAASVRLFGG
jgi:ABC-type molybdate transport system ATPase subunit